MQYQLLPLSDANQFEKLTRDILRRVYDDPTIECFGRTGQGQHGIDGSSAADKGLTFQCKLKSTEHSSDEAIRKILLKEMADELVKTSGLEHKPTRFTSVFFSFSALLQTIPP